MFTRAEKRESMFSQKQKRVDSWPGNQSVLRQRRASSMSPIKVFTLGGQKLTLHVDFETTSCVSESFQDNVCFSFKEDRGAF